MSIECKVCRDQPAQKFDDDRPPHIKALVNRAIREYAHILPFIIEQRNDGKSMIEIARWLNAAGYRTRKNCDFTQSTVCKILKRSGASSVN